MRESINVRIAFTTASEVDSRRIIDHPGAVNLLGKGDMYFKESEGKGLMRIQAPYVSDDDVSTLTDKLRDLRQVKYIDLDTEPKTYSDENDNELYEDALKFIIDEQKAGTAMLQMKFQIGYGRAARLIERLEEDGIVGPADGSAARDVYRSEY
jgi:S-DNA-T family DNA segregation ATPase FtsK/SpoIIIE